MPGRIHAKVELVAERVELFTPGLRASGVGGQGVGADPQLLSDKAQRWLGNRVTRSQQAAWIAEGTELQGEAELVVLSAAALDGSEVSSVQGPVTHQQRFIDGNREQALDLRVCQHSASRHGGCPK